MGLGGALAIRPVHPIIGTIHGERGYMRMDREQCQFNVLADACNVHPTFILSACTLIGTVTNQASSPRSTDFSRRGDRALRG